MKFLLRPILGTLVLLGSIVYAPAAFAAPITGVLNITGSVRVGSDPALGGILDFLPVATGGGDFHVDAFTQSGSFLALANTNGTILDLNQTAQPVGTDFVLNNFITFAADPNISLTLTHILPGTFSSADCFSPAAGGQTCTIPAGPFGPSQFNLSNTTATSSVVSFSVRGKAVNGLTGEETPLLGTFSTQFTNMSYQDILNQINSGGFVEATYSANFNVVPEPASSVLLLCGGIMLAVGLIRKHRSLITNK